MSLIVAHRLDVLLVAARGADGAELAGRVRSARRWHRYAGGHAPDAGDEGRGLRALRADLDGGGVGSQSLIADEDAVDGAVGSRPALVPMAMLPLPVVLVESASKPTAVLKLPVSLEERICPQRGVGLTFGIDGERNDSHRDVVHPGCIEPERLHSLLPYCRCLCFDRVRCARVRYCRSRCHAGTARRSRRARSFRRPARRCRCRGSR